MGRNTGGAPSNFTLPVIEPAVAGSTTAVGGGGPEDSLGSFLLQPMMATKSVTHSARTADRRLNKTIPFSQVYFSNKASASDCFCGFSRADQGGYCGEGAIDARSVDVIVRHHANGESAGGAAQDIFFR